MKTVQDKNLLEMPIGVFDSGMGGLTVMREIMRQIPNEKVIYFGDTARVPYGSKSKETVTRFSRQIVRFLQSKQVKAIVVACNTASAYALNDLEREIDIPIIGVVKPGAKVAAEVTRNGQVGDERDIAAGYMDVAIPISGGDNSYIIYIRDNRSTVSSLNSELLIIILQALLVGLLISVLLSFLLSKTMINPIEKLTEGAERVASGDFSEKLEVDSTDEIGILTTTFNDMASVLHSTLEAVEDERNKLDTLFLHMTDGVVAYDRDGALIHCNPAASELLERSADECVYADLFEPLCPFEKVMAMQRSDFVASELTVGERTVELYFAPFSDEERGGVLVVLHDVTQQRKAEERRREFVANVSHELRTPLTNIRSYAETIRDAGDELPRELENSFLDIVINESDRMTHIVQDLLTLSRLDSGRSEMNMARFDFGAAIDSVLRSIELEARRHGHELTHDYHDLPMIMGDRGRIEQVMLNVLGNAVKYTPDGGHIRVTAGTVGERVWMEVADDGIGIPKADRSRIFERFYRVDKARSRESGGTGLGLSIATEIVQRHNGTLSLVDREGPGTTVRLELPIRQSEVGGAQEGGNG